MMLQSRGAPKAALHFSEDKGTRYAFEKSAPGGHRAILHHYTDKANINEAGSGHGRALVAVREKSVGPELAGWLTVTSTAHLGHQGMKNSSFEAMKWSKT